MRDEIQTAGLWTPTAFVPVAVLTLAFSFAEALAQVVGDVGAVNPLSQGTPPRREDPQHRDRRARHRQRTHPYIGRWDQLNIAFLDRTTMSIGRNSTLIIDKYVYDPATGKGVLTATMAQGVLRFIGGQISHTTGVKVLTPVATIGVRGGMMTVSVGADGVSVMSHYGHIDVANGGNISLYCALALPCMSTAAMITLLHPAVPHWQNSTKYMVAYRAVRATTIIILVRFQMPTQRSTDSATYRCPMIRIQCRVLTL